MRTAFALACALPMACGAPSHAAAPDPFPNQPGALTADEIMGATEAMKGMLQGAPQLPLVASGRRKAGHPMPSYALFAIPLPDLFGRVKRRWQIVCNVVGGMWRCSEAHEHFRMTANGMEHAFTYQVLPGGSADRQVAVEIVDYMYFTCFRDQLEGLGRKPWVPSPDTDFVSAVLDDGKGYSVMTGPFADSATYRLARADRSRDGCPFRLVSARTPQASVVAGESGVRATQQPAAPPVAPPAAQEHAREAVAREPVAREAEAFERRAREAWRLGHGLTFRGSIVFVLLALAATGVLAWALMRGAPQEPATEHATKPGQEAGWGWWIALVAGLVLLVGLLT